MKPSRDQLSKMLALKQFPRASEYDPEWVMENQMGPNVLWLTEWVTELVDLKPGMRVLDMGCGKALSSIFLAREFDVEVWANDLWIKASENWERIKAAGLEKRIFPIHAEARSAWRLRDSSGISRDGVPEHFTRPQSNGAVFWAEDCWTFHTIDWWRNLWGRTTLVSDDSRLPEGQRRLLSSP